MEVNNVSKLASKDVLKKLFSIVGNVLCFEHYPNIAARDGSYQCDIVFANLCEAKRAVRLCGTVLGDRILTVVLITSSKRFRSHRTSERVRRALQVQCQTGLLNGLNSKVTNSEIAAICAGPGAVRDIVRLDNDREALVEFMEPSGIILATERLKIAALPDGTHAKIEEAWRRIDPDYMSVRDADSQDFIASGQKQQQQQQQKRQDYNSSTRSNRQTSSRSRSRSRDKYRDYDKRHGQTSSSFHRSNSRSGSKPRSRSRSRSPHHNYKVSHDNGYYHRR